MTFIAFSLLILLLYSSGHLVCSALYRCHEPVRRKSVGIHLGTTYSSVGAFKNQCHLRNISSWEDRSLEWWHSNAIQVIPNELGRKFSPSCVAFTHSGVVLIGEAAKAFNPERTVCGITRLLGKKFDDPGVQSLIKSLPYEVVNLENKPHVKVNISNGEAKVFSAEEICAMILGRMKEIAEAYLGREITIAGVTVPSYFDEAMVQEIDGAGKMVGFKMIDVDLSRKVGRFVFNGYQEGAKFLVYDLGGSAFDVSLEMDGGGTIASKGESQLGGDSFDARVVDHFVKLIKNKYNKDISKDMSALTRLRHECEKAKISLSNTDQVRVKIESLVDGIDVFEELLTREIFDELNMDLFNRTIDIVKEVMEEGGVEMKDIEGFVVVGGSTQIPKIRHMLKELFGEEPLNKSINPGEVLTYAAALSGGWLSGEWLDPPCNFPFVALNPMSVGIETIGGFMAHIVKSRDCLPMKTSRDFTTYYDGQTTAEILVLEGERPLTRDGHFLGKLEISGIHPAPRGVPTIEVTVEMYEDLSMKITARDKATQKIESIGISAEQRYEDDYSGTEYVRPVPAIRRKVDLLEDAVEMEELKATMAAYPTHAYSRRFAVVDKEDSLGPAAS